MKRMSADRTSGIAFLAVAVCFGIPSFSYGLGSTLRFGAGMFPLVISGLLAIVGATMVLGSSAPASAEAVKSFDLRAMAAIMAGLIVGAIMLQQFGLLIAVPSTVIVASFASRELRPIGVLAAAAVLTLFVWLVFVAGLHLPIPVFLWR